MLSRLVRSFPVPKSVGLDEKVVVNELGVWAGTFSLITLFHICDFDSLKSYLSPSNADLGFLYDSKLMHWYMLPLKLRRNRYLVEMEVIFKKVRFT